MQAGGRGRAIAILGAVVALALAVALASRPVHLTSANATDLSLLHLLADVGLYLLAVITVVVIAITIWALWPNGWQKRKPPKRRWWEYLLPYLSLLLLFGLVSYLIANPRALRRLRRSPLAQLFQGLQNQRTRASLHGGPPTAAGPDWTAIAIVAVIVAAAAALIIWRLIVEHRRRPTPRELALNLEEVLEAGLRGLQPEAPEPLDAREAVIAAWAGFERALGRAGVPVWPGEAPHEYLDRALRETSLRLDPAALRSFTDLFEWARYSTNPVTEAMREQAVTTFRAVRDELHRQAEPDLQVAPA